MPLFTPKALLKVSPSSWGCVHPAGGMWAAGVCSWGGKSHGDAPRWPAPFVVPGTVMGRVLKGVLPWSHHKDAPPQPAVVGCECLLWGGSHVGGISRESLIQGGDTLVNLGREMRGCKPHRVAAEILKANTMNGAASGGLPQQQAWGWQGLHFGGGFPCSPVPSRGWVQRGAEQRDQRGGLRGATRELRVIICH